MPSHSPVSVDDFQRLFHRIRDELGRVIIGYRDVIDQILIAFFAGGHVLIEGVPGTGKTLMVHPCRGPQPQLPPDPIHRGPDAG